MVRSRSRKYNRIGERHWWQFQKLFAAVFIGLILLVLVLSKLSVPKYDFGVVEISNPITVYWWNAIENRFALVKVPIDVFSNADPDYSHYSLMSLWKLGEQSDYDTLRLNKVLSLTLHVPLKWYIKSKNDQGSFNFPKTNMPIQMALFFSWQKHFIDSSHRDEHDFTDISLYQKRKLPDGRDTFYFDERRLETRLSHMFEQKKLREENLRVAILNGSNTPGLGDSVSKIMNQLGIYVGFVQNRDSTVSPCLVSGSRVQLETYTSILIQDLFECQRKITEIANPYDLEVTVTADMFPMSPKD